MHESTEHSSPILAVPYARPGIVRYRRPSIITVLGVVGLFVGALGGIANGVFLRDARRLYGMTTPPPNAFPPPPLIPTSVLTPHHGDFIGRGGLSKALRQSFLEAVDARAATKLGADRRVMLDRLLAEVGGDAVQGVNDPAAAIVDVQQQDVSPVTPRTRGLEPHRIRVAGGTIDVTQSTAEFTDNPGRHFRVDWDVFTRYGGGRTWTATVLNAAVETLQDDSSGSLSPVQGAAIIDVVRKVNPPPVAATDRNTAGPFRGCKVLSAGTVEVRRDVQSGGVLWVLANGAVAYPPVPTDTSDWDPATGQKRWYPPKQLSWLPVSPHLAKYVLVDMYVGLALAVVLIALSILLLFDVVPSRRMLLAYCVIKIFAAIALVIVSAKIVDSLAAELAARHMQPAAKWMSPGALGGQAFLGLFAQCVMPIVLLIALTRSGVRSYFRHLGEGSPPGSTLAPSLWNTLTSPPGSVIVIVSGGIVAMAQLFLLLRSASASLPFTATAHAGGAILAIAAAALCAWRWRRSVTSVNKSDSSCHSSLTGGVKSALWILMTFALVLAAPGTSNSAPAETGSKPSLEELMQTVRDSDRSGGSRAIEKMLGMPSGKIAVLRLLSDAKKKASLTATHYVANNWPFTLSDINDDKAAFEVTARAMPVLLARATADTDSDDAWQAVMAFRKLGKPPGAAEACARCLDTATSPIARGRALGMLSTYTRGAVDTPYFRKAMKDDSNDIRMLAGQWMATHADPSEFQKLLQDPDPKMREVASGLIALRKKNMPAESTQLMAELQKKAVTDPSAEVRHESIRALQRIGPDAINALFEVVEHASREDDKVDAMSMLSTFCGNGNARRSQIYSRFNSLLSDPRPEVQRAGLRGYESQCGDQLPLSRVIDLLESPDADVAGTAAITLDNNGMRGGPVTREVLRSRKSIIIDGRSHPRIEHPAEATPQAWNDRSMPAPLSSEDRVDHAPSSWASLAVWTVTFVLLAWTTLALLQSRTDGGNLPAKSLDPKEVAGLPTHA